MSGAARRFSAIFLILILFYSSLVMAEKPLRLVTLSFRPFIYSEGGKIKGIDAEILKELFRRSNIKYEIEILPWKRALFETKQGTADAVFPAFITAEREEYADFMVRPLHLSDYFIFVKKG